MKFGLHYLLSVSASQSPTQRYRDTLEQAVHAEALGFESVWPVEQHFNQLQSALPCPTLLLAAIAARTTTLRLGTAIVQLPLAHPLRTAEEIATLDVLSGGRVEFGVGRGSQPRHFAGFGVPLSDSRDRMIEALDYLRVAFTHDRFSFDGRFFHADDICLVPKPVQRPHPPIRIAANSPDSFELAGRLGYPILVATHINPLPKLRELLGASGGTLRARRAPAAAVVDADAGRRAQLDAVLEAAVGTKPAAACRLHHRRAALMARRGLPRRAAARPQQPARAQRGAASPNEQIGAAASHRRARSIAVRRCSEPRFAA